MEIETKSYRGQDTEEEFRQDPPSEKRMVERGGAKNVTDLFMWATRFSLAERDISSRRGLERFRRALREYGPEQARGMKLPRGGRRDANKRRNRFIRLPIEDPSWMSLAL